MHILIKIDENVVGKVKIQPNDVKIMIFSIKPSFLEFYIGIFNFLKLKPVKSLFSL